MQQLEARHRITVRTVRVDRQGATCVTEIVRFGDAANVEDAAMVGFANETDESGNTQRGRVFNRHAAKESQTVASRVVEPVFPAGRVFDPLRVIATGKGRGGLTHPRHARRPRPDVQAAVKRSQPTERKNTDCAIFPSERDVAWRLRLSRLQAWL